MVSHRIRFWVGPVDAEDFVSLVADLLAMLTRRDSQEALTLAATDWRDDHVLGYQAVTALERQEHAISRLKIVAALTKCLLGPRAFEFFRFHSAGCLGRKSLYPFAILFRELSAEQKAKLIERAQHRPEPLAKQVAKVAEAAARQATPSAMKDRATRPCSESAAIACAVIVACCLAWVMTNRKGFPVSFTS